MLFTANRFVCLLLDTTDTVGPIDVVTFKSATLPAKKQNFGILIDTDHLIMRSGKKQVKREIPRDDFVIKNYFTNGKNPSFVLTFKTRQFSLNGVDFEKHEDNVNSS
ncbi:hypothetical protein HF086_011527 [Spodoptera exigua]|uniref:Uncharacterized protein n=1 Tax=Spodoptera exigua TaxID=7107 RepID=A0A922MD47_SPOEX|nr:hypothetical protein HF086_011527 [Spodoptera exigua]